MWGNSLGLADQRSGIRGQRNLQRMAREVETKETKTLVLSTKGGAAVGLLHYLCCYKQGSGCRIFFEVPFYFSRINRKRFVVIEFLD